MLKWNFAIFFASSLKESLGGPSGYLFNLKTALQKRGEGEDGPIHFILSAENRYSVFHAILKFFVSLIPNKKIRRKAKEHVKKLHVSRILNGSPKIEVLMCHSCWDLNFIYGLWEHGYVRYPKPKLILMSHSPTLPFQELSERLSYSGKRIGKDLKKFDLEAFSHADLVVAPSENAMNSYSKECKNLFLNKRIFYLPTGRAPLVKHDKELMRKKFNIKTKYVVCYVGRHWEVKGYDRVIDIANIVLKTRDDVTFLIAGKLNPAIAPLNHPRWIELGWADSSEVFSCSDIFLLPSRESYFDLVIIEALSVGLKCILSRVGGNVDFNIACPLIDLFSSNKEAVAYINSFLSLSSQERMFVEKELMGVFNDKFSDKCFADRYIDFERNLANYFNK